MNDSTDPKILLVGWNAAGWDVLTPILDRGELPNLGELVEGGVSGEMTSIRPLMEPTVYSSVATGKYPDKHGILGTHEPCNHGQAIQPITSLSRRAKAFWEILSQNDIPCNVVHFPTAGPAEQINGTFVGCSFFGPPPTSNWDPVHVPEGSVNPADMGTRLQEFIVSLEDMDSQTVGLFVPRMSELPPRDERLAKIAMVIAHTLSVHTVATWLMENTEWRVMSVNYPAIAVFSEHFLRYHPPRLDWVDEDEFNLFSGVVNSSVRLCDLLLGRLLQLAGENATVIVYSPRAYLAHHQVPQHAEPMGPRSEAKRHRPRGIFVMRADGTRRDELVHGVREVAVCPTLLRLCDIAVPEDMDGRVLTDAFGQPLPKSQTIDTWETRPPCRPELAEDRHPIPWAEMMSFTSSYARRVALRVGTQNEWSLAEACLRTPRSHLAIPLLTRLYYTNPFRTDAAPLVAEALYHNHLVEESLTVARNFAAIHGRTPSGKFMAGVIAQQEGRDFEALDLFEDAARENPPIAQLHFYMGEIYRRTGRPDRALECFNTAIEISPDYIPGYLGRVQVYRKSKDYEAAAEEALKVVAIDFSFSPAHYLLGTCVEELGEREQAKAAYENALRFDSNYEPAKVRLEALQAGGKPEALDEDEPIPVAISRCDAGEMRLQARRVTQEITAWANHYVQHFRQADEQLDAYLTENARQLAEQRGESPPAEPIDMQTPNLKDKGLVLRPVMPADLGQVAQLVSLVLTEPHRHDVYVLHKEGENQLFGAVSLRMSDDTGERIRLVAHPMPVAAAADLGLDEETTGWILIRAGLARAAAAGVSEIIYALSPVGREHVVENLERLAFRVKKRESVFSMDMAAMRDRCLRVVDRCRKRQVIPDNVEVVSLQDMPMYQVDRFFQGFFDDGIGPRRLDLDERLSLLVLRDRKIIAAYTGFVQGETWVSPRLAVLEEYQNGWATPMLIGRGAEAGYNAGLRTIQLYADETVFPEMIRIGRRIGAEELARTWTLSLPLVAPWSQL